jgi:hypothetical protein
MKFEPYYDQCMEQWSVRDTETFVMYPCTSENMANEFTKLLNELNDENQQLKHDLEIYEENNTNEVLNQLRIELTSRLNDCIEEFKQ